MENLPAWTRLGYGLMAYDWNASRPDTAVTALSIAEGDAQAQIMGSLDKVEVYTLRY